MDTRETSRSGIDEVDLMLANAALRDALEPYWDESIDDPSTRRMSLSAENEYLESMLAWERAPALPIAQWFSPPLQLPCPDQLSDTELAAILYQTIERLSSQHVVLLCTDHLSDRELYKLIYCDILPSYEKQIPGQRIEFRCVADNETWLRYYASAVERRRYQEDHAAEIPPAESPRYPRQLPG